MLVEDETELRGLTAELLASEGYKVLTAEDGKAAIKIASQPTMSINLLLTDVILPDMSGADLVARVREILPGVKVLYMSGYAGTQVVRQGILESEPFLEKPFTKESLLQTLRDLLSEASRPMNAI